jgi:hypothetical protein
MPLHGTAGRLQLDSCAAIDKHRVYVVAQAVIEQGRFTALQLSRRLDHRWAAVVAPQIGPGQLTVFSQWGISDGPFVHPTRHRRGELWATWRYQNPSMAVRLVAAAYSSRWSESGLISQRAVKSGFLNRFSSADPTGGGDQDRLLAAATIESRSDQRQGWQITLRTDEADFQLFTNPTLFAKDRRKGDQQEVRDHHSTTGFDLGYWVVANGKRLQWKTAFNAHADFASAQVQVWHSQRRARLNDCFGDDNPCLRANLTDRRLRATVSETIAAKHWQVEAALQLHQATWSVDDMDAETAQSSKSRGGSAARARLVPALQSQYQVSKHVTLLTGINGKVYSTHSLAAVERNAFAAMSRIWSIDATLRVRPSSDVSASFTAWRSYHQAHLTWDVTSTSSLLIAKKKLAGFDASLFWQASPSVRFAADLSVARQPTNGSAPDDAPLARLFGSATIDYKRGPLSVAGRIHGMSTRVLGQRDEGNVAVTAPFTITDVAAGYAWRQLSVGVSVSNLFNIKWDEEARLTQVRRSPTADIQQDILSSPGGSRMLMFSVGVIK